MCIPYSHASPPSMRAKDSARLTLPARTDLTSGPVRARPASQVSSTWYSCSAFLFRAMTFRPSPRCSFAARESFSMHRNVGTAAEREKPAPPSVDQNWRADLDEVVEGPGILVGQPDAAVGDAALVRVRPQHELRLAGPV